MCRIQLDHFFDLCFYHTNNTDQLRILQCQNLLFCQNMQQHMKQHCVQHGYGQPKMKQSLFLSITLVFNEFLLPIFTLVLSTENPRHFFPRKCIILEYFSNCLKY